MKATSVPKASVPARIWPPPYQTMIAKETELIASISEKSDAS